MCGTGFIHTGGGEPVRTGAWCTVVAFGKRVLGAQSPLPDGAAVAIKFWLPGPPHPLPDSSASRPGDAGRVGPRCPPWAPPGRIVPLAAERQCLAIPLGGPGASPWTAEGGRTAVAQPCARARPLGGGWPAQPTPGSLLAAWCPASGVLEGHSEPALAGGGGAAGSCNVERGPVAQ